MRVAAAKAAGDRMAGHCRLRSAMLADYPSETDDRQLVVQAQQGDLRAFNALVERYQRSVYNLALHMLRDPAMAEDATQEAFFSAYRHITRFRGGSLRSWLMTIVANGCRDLLRSPHMRRTRSLEAITEQGDPGGPWPSPEASPEEQALQQELGGQVREALAQLPEDQRLVVTLVDLHGLGYEEAAKVTGVSLGTVKSRLSRARDRLRIILRPAMEQSEGLPRQ